MVRWLFRLVAGGCFAQLHAIWQELLRYYGLNQPATTVAPLRRSVELNPQSAPVSNQFANAIDAFQHANKLEPGHLKLLAEIGSHIRTAIAHRPPQARRIPRRSPRCNADWLRVTLHPRLRVVRSRAAIRWRGLRERRSPFASRRTWRRPGAFLLGGRIAGDNP